MHNYWFHIWWLIFPLAGFGFAFWGMWIRYQRQKATIELLRGYAAQGKEPPAELVRVLHHDQPRAPYRDWRRALLFGTLAAALGIIAYLHDAARPREGLIIGAVVLAALAANSTVAALLLRKHDAT